MAFPQAACLATTPASYTTVGVAPRKKRIHLSLLIQSTAVSARPSPWSLAFSFPTPHRCLEQASLILLSQTTWGPACRLFSRPPRRPPPCAWLLWAHSIATSKSPLLSHLGTLAAIDDPGRRSSSSFTSSDFPTTANTRTASHPALLRVVEPCDCEGGALEGTLAPPKGLPRPATTQTESPVCQDAECSTWAEDTPACKEDLLTGTTLHRAAIYLDAAIASNHMAAQQLMLCGVDAAEVWTQPCRLTKLDVLDETHKKLCCCYCSPHASPLS